MSDLCLYELQDNVWDEFNEIDDHIVPRPADDTGNKYTVQSGSHKKVRVEVDPTSTADCGKKFIVRGKREASSQILVKGDKMLDQGQWCCASDGAFASSRGDTVKEDTCMVSGDSTLTDNCFKSGSSSEPCARDSIMGDPSVSVDNNLYDYHLSQISQSESSLNFFDDGDKEYYGWPDIGNFEDVDKMFSGCDSTFGLGSLTNDADLGWFSPSTAIEGSENALRSSFKISCSGSTLLRSDLENHIDYGPQRDDNSPEESRKKSTGSYDSLRPQSTCIGEVTSADNVQLVGGSEMKSESKEDSVPHEEVMNLPTKQTERPNKMKGKKKEEYPENSASLQRGSLSKPILDAKASHTLSVQIPNFIASDYCHQVSQVSECPSLPSIKYVNDSHLSPRLKESSHASNQAWSTDPHGNSFEVPSGKNDGTVRAYNHHQLQASKARGLNHLDVLDASSPAAISDPVAVLKRMHRNVNDSGDHSEAGVCAGVATGLDNSLAQETSSMSSMVDEISLEATSFRQLQQVMEKLDIRTKLCIRDSLYRLARSAEQRHNCLTPNIASNNEEAGDGDILLDDSNKCNDAFMDVETDTNPIDRSVAHLLFHRPKDQNAMPGNDPVSPKTNTNAATGAL